jgi:calcium/proton exchanger cax
MLIVSLLAGLILVPLVEKAAEHITAIDEAWDDQMNFALSHILGASIQTALLNTPLAVIVGWGLVCYLRVHLQENWLLTTSQKVHSMLSSRSHGKNQIEC